MKEQELFAAKEQGKLLINAIKIIDKLSKNSIADSDTGDESEADQEFKDLVLQARSLTSNTWWELLKK